MKKVKVNVIEVMNEMVPNGMLEKDLQENEVICEKCKGLGVISTDGVYGIQGEKSDVMFPYNNRAFTLCNECYGGVNKVCSYCGKVLRNSIMLKCDCDKSIEAGKQREEEKWEKINKEAKEVEGKDVTNMLYCVENNEFYTDMEGFYDEWTEKMVEKYGRPERLWVTERTEIGIDADYVVEDACNELHEDAKDRCDVEELQEMLNEWCAKQTGTTTYTPLFKEYVRVTWAEM